MTRSRRVSMLIAATAVVIASAGGGVALAISAQRSLPYGVNFGIHPIADTNFCLESEGDGRMLISQCVTRDNQHFTFTHNTDDTNTIVDGYGLCLDRGDGKPGTALTSAPCTFGPTQRFQYTAAGKLQRPGATSCIEASEAAQNASVFDAKCTGSKTGKIFQLSH